MTNSCITSLSDLRSEEFDYVVVGAGIGGMVVATRLSEDADATVLLVEAGANRMEDPRVVIPGYMASMYGDPDFDWDIMSEPQVHVNGRQIPQPRGKLLGGSSALNFSAILYPTKEDFNAWEALGNEGWSAEAMAPYLRKFHTFTPASPTTHDLLSLDYMDKDKQGRGGPLPVTIPEVYGDFNKAWMSTFEKLGWPASGDPIAGERLGAFTCPLSVDPKTKARGYAASYYTPEVAARPNLQILCETQVEKVLLEKDSSNGDLTATGVQVATKDGHHTAIRARREVILSAGALHTPQLLELSGIGSPDILQAHGIPCQLPLPGVGENLQDHAICAFSYEVADGQVSGDVLRDPAVLEALTNLYRDAAAGPLTGSPISIAYLPPVDGDGPLSAYTIEELLQAAPPPPSDNPALRAQYDVLTTLYRNPTAPTGEYMYLPLQLHMHPTGPTPMRELLAKSNPGNYITIMVLLNHPFSRGSVHLSSASPTHPPRYDPNYLAHPLDLAFLARHAQYIDHLASTPPLAALLRQPLRRIPAEAPDSRVSLAAAQRLVRERLFTCFHPCGTAAMGEVLDPRLRIRGVRGLRVVDASVFPLIPVGNIQATVYAVAEKAADLIREDWRR